jgi:succinate dehydrogenase/fumarate reductase flavoprotein subunit
MKKLFYDVVVVGSGCAGLNAVSTLLDAGNDSVALVSEGLYKGTSRNTGSDKQTYYKLSMAGAIKDSVADMAETLSACGEVDKEVSYTEACNSIPCFLKLVNLGVEFPTNKYGEYIGYQTDHDIGKRATSAGPLTSRAMWYALYNSIKDKNYSLFDGYTAIKIIKTSDTVSGIVCMNAMESIFIGCNNLILATGGPSGIYKDSVYPESQRGMSSLALRVGAKATNFQHFQYGIASTKFRWNLSGTYQQVIPRYLSIDEDGVEREFLSTSDLSLSEIYSRVFLKGYQWPFDSNKIDGSSYIDVLVHKEILKNRKVFLDYTKNPKEFSFDLLSKEAFEYLKKSNGLKDTPFERLKEMNPLAIDLYKNHDIDLSKEYLEIKVCSQNHNGGILVDCNYQTTIENLFVVGEAAGTFGAYRPGGTALNSTQVGSLRAASTIIKRDASYEKDEAAIDEQLLKLENLIASLKNRKSKSNISLLMEEISEQMSKYASYIRDLNQMEQLEKKLQIIIDEYFSLYSIEKGDLNTKYFEVYDNLLSSKVALSSMIFAAKNIGSYGGAISTKNNKIIESKELIKNRRVVSTLNKSHFEEITDFKKEEDWFETVWARYRNEQKKIHKKG